MRKSRFTPTPDRSIKRRPTVPTLDVLEAVHEQELVRSSILDVLLPHRNHKGLRRTLANLHLAGLVDKAVHESQSLYCPDIYLVSERGENFLHDYRNPNRFVNSYRPRGDYRIEFKHKLGISDTIGNLRAGAIKAGCTILSQSEIAIAAGLDPALPLRLPASVEADIDGKRLSWKGEFEPDGLFGIEYPDGTTSYIALEYQNTGKVRANKLYGVSSVRRKFLAYIDAYKKKAFKAWGISNLRVLFVFANEGDYRQSMTLGEEMYPKGNPMFLLTHVPDHRYTKTGIPLAPDPVPDLLFRKLDRINKEPVALYE